MDAIGSISTAGLSTPVVQPRLVQAAHEFEAQLMKELLKPMTAGTSLDGEESDIGSASVLGDFASEALGQALSRQGGLGIATSIVHSLSQNEKTFLDSPETGKRTVFSLHDRPRASSEVERCR
jgi:Rod binding domain-containing protein